ncbi:TonB-dependent receptor [Indibacter alkaliphilus LW1]|uniref:TonB-dependent receptor n=1 Tax=Indibacter alkaliphilus (strain CCUG 57479 / KCTC 22604 / LW1) TaxID=1189612 RepID=S2D9V6_INDAL|nr:capsule assembly Wzi family protein [Indibacter alkaliphilus]EOZ95674.1 TonB-dependent receptor [Indibacter alkaliphilus LW1]
MFRARFLFLLFFSVLTIANGQDIPAGFPVLEEYERRLQLMDTSSAERSFLLRPMSGESIRSFEYLDLFRDEQTRGTDKDFKISVLPVINSTAFNSRRPYGWGNGIMHPNVGFQTYLSGGVSGKYKFLRFRFQPELHFAENRRFQGFPNTFSDNITFSRFRFWNTGDFPERFGSGPSLNYWWGQSKVSAVFGAFEAGISTENIWWGPGQFNALIFSNNAQGFPHITLKTHKPAKTFLGNFEGQLVVGRLENSMLPATQHPELNRQFGRRLTGDWRFLNALSITYSPKWVDGLFVGVNRSYQQYSESKEPGLRNLFPIFDPFQKENFGFDRDGEGRDQQLTGFIRYLNKKAKTELYFEYGRRDHALNWREFILNPEHARAYLVGFNKIFSLENSSHDLQVRGEIVHQQESVNRYIRYLGLGGNVTWHTHWNSRGFVNYGQPLGVGIGVGSNSQTIEFALVDGINKKGVLIERLENHQDFYYRAFGQQNSVKPWIDLSVGLLWDQKWNNFLLGSKVQMINGHNYQWQLADSRQETFSKGLNLFSVYSQVHLIYFIKKERK